MSRARWAAVLVLALAFRLAALCGYHDAPAKDAAEYDWLGWSLAEGQGYVDGVGRTTAFRPPGQAGLLAAVYLVRGHDVGAARVVLAVISTAIVAATALLAAALAGPAAALPAGLLAAIYPSFIWSDFGSRTLLAETLLTALLSWALVVLLRQPGLAGAIMAGSLFGLAALTRGTALLALAAAAAVLVSRGASGRRRAALLALAAAAVVAPWMVRNRLVLAAWVPISSNGGLTLWQSYNPASRGLGHGGEGFAAILAADAEMRARGIGEAERSRAFAAMARREIAAHPGRAARLVARKVILFLDPTLEDPHRAGGHGLNLGYAFALPFAVLGAASVARGPRRRELALVAAAALAYGAAHVLLHTAVRYRLAVEPVLIALAGAGLVELAGRAGTRRGLMLAAAWAAAVALAGWRYAAVFAALSRLARGLGLG